jgi:hypothetical protein
MLSGGRGSLESGRELEKRDAYPRAAQAARPLQLVLGTSNQHPQEIHNQDTPCFGHPELMFE